MASIHDNCFDEHDERRFLPVGVFDLPVESSADSDARPDNNAALLDGEWRDASGLVGAVNRGILRWAYPVDEENDKSSLGFASDTTHVWMDFFGEKIFGSLDGGELRWGTGDVWRRAAPPPAEPPPAAPSFIYTAGSTDAHGLHRGRQFDEFAATIPEGTRCSTSTVSFAGAPSLPPRERSPPPSQPQWPRTWAMPPLLQDKGLPFAQHSRVNWGPPLRQAPGWWFVQPPTQPPQHPPNLPPGRLPQ